MDIFVSTVLSETATPPIDGFLAGTATPLTEAFLAGTAAPPIEALLAGTAGPPIDALLAGTVEAPSVALLEVANVPGKGALILLGFRPPVISKIDKDPNEDIYKCM